MRISSIIYSGMIVMASAAFAMGAVTTAVSTMQHEEEDRREHGLRIVSEEGAENKEGEDRDDVRVLASPDSKKVSWA